MKQKKLFWRIWKAYGGIGRGSFFFFYRWLVFPHFKVQSHVPDHGKIYDLGCGYGIFSALLALSGPGREVTGVDTSAMRINQAERMGRSLGLDNLKFSRSDFLKMDFAEPGAIILVDVLHHAGDWATQKALLGRLLPAIHRGGKMIIIDVQPANSWKYYLGLLVDTIFYFGSKVHYPPKNELKKFLEDGGFSLETLELHHGMPYMNYMLVGTKR